MGVMGLTRISKEAQALLSAMVRSMTPQARNSYLKYCQGPGFPMADVRIIQPALDLYRAGWLKTRPDIAEPQPLFLSHEAWERYSLKDWNELEEAELKSKRGPLAGSW